MLQINSMSFNRLDANNDRVINTPELLLFMNGQSVSSAQLQDPQVLEKVTQAINMHFKDNPTVPFMLSIDGAAVKISWGARTEAVTAVATDEGSGAGGVIAQGSIDLPTFNARTRVAFEQDLSGHAEFPGDVYKFSLGVGLAGITDAAMVTADTNADIKEICSQGRAGTGVSLAYMQDSLKNIMAALDTGNAQQLNSYNKTLLEKYSQSVDTLLQFLEQQGAQEITLNGKAVQAPFTKDALLRSVIDTHATQMKDPSIDLARNNGAFQIVLVVTKALPQDIAIPVDSKPYPLADTNFALIRRIPRKLGEFGSAAKFPFSQVFQGLRTNSGVTISCDKQATARGVTPAMLDDPQNLVYEYNVVVRDGELKLLVTLNDSRSPIIDTSVENRYTFTLSGTGLVDYLKGMTIDEQTKVVQAAGAEAKTFIAQIFETYTLDHLRDNLFSIPANYIDRTDKENTSAAIQERLTTFFTSTFNTLEHIDPESKRAVLQMLSARYGTAGSGTGVSSLDARYGRSLIPTLQSFL